MVNKIFKPFTYVNIKPMPLLLNNDDKCLVIAPHPDDESIGCGGVISLYPQNFDVICLTHGDISDIRYREFQEAMNFAKVKTYFHLNLPDKHIIESYNIFEKTDFTKNYDYIFIPYPFDQHRDHKAVSILLSKFLQTHNYKENLKICFYEVWSTINMPQFYVDISSVMDKKIEMINYHRSQISSKDYAEKIICLNKYRGLLKNIEAAEAFGILDVHDFQMIVSDLFD